MTNEDTSPGQVKRTCGTVVAHLGAYKSQLVATIVPYIYMCVINSNLIARDGIRFPTDHLNDPFLSSVCLGPGDVRDFRAKTRKREGSKAIDFKRMESPSLEILSEKCSI